VSLKNACIKVFNIPVYLDFWIFLALFGCRDTTGIRAFLTTQRPVTRLTFVFTHAYDSSGSSQEKRPNKSTNQELQDTLD
jgi:hypothetical protein